LGAGGGNSLIAYLQDEVTLFEGPLATSTNKGEFLGWKLEGNSLGLSWLQRDLRKVAQTLIVWYDTGNEIARIKQYSLLTGFAACILHIHADGKNVISSKLRLVNLQVRVFEGGVAEAIAEGPLYA